jgi:nitrate/TMAO reductase-like tetraheme cytochrome c subunit
MPNRVTRTEAQPANQQQREANAEQRTRADCHLAIAPRLLSLRLFYVEISVHKSGS